MKAKFVPTRSARNRARIRACRGVGLMMSENKLAGRRTAHSAAAGCRHALSGDPKQSDEERPAIENSNAELTYFELVAYPLTKSPKPQEAA
jgi:hypothetical protein